MEAGSNGKEQSGSGEMFCLECCQLLLEIKSPHRQVYDGRRDHHQSYLAYAEAVASGCLICTRLPLKHDESYDWSFRLECFYRVMPGRATQHPSNAGFGLQFKLLGDFFGSENTLFLPALSNPGRMTRLNQ